jgi:hypothetical protein
MTFLTDALALVQYVIAPHMHALLFLLVAVVWGYVTLTGWNPLYRYLTRRNTHR